MSRAILAGALCALVLPAIGWADDGRAGKPSATFCWMARGALAEAGSEAAAEKAARARGVSEATIAKAKRCPR